MTGPTTRIVVLSSFMTSRTSEVCWVAESENTLALSFGLEILQVYLECEIDEFPGQLAREGPGVRRRIRRRCRRPGRVPPGILLRSNPSNVPVTWGVPDE